MVSMESRSLSYFFSGLVAVCAIFAAAEAGAANDLGYLQVGSALTLDASTPEFQFTTLEILSGATLTFSGLEASDLLVLRASEAIRIDGALVFDPANAIWIEAPQIEIGSGVLLNLPGGSITLSASNSIIMNGTINVLAGFPSVSIPVASGTITLNAPTSGTGIIDGSGLLIAPGGSINLQSPGSISLQSPVPEPDTWTMLVAGMGLVGFAVRRRKTMNNQARNQAGKRYSACGRQTPGLCRFHILRVRIG
jgi:hypothetical protein